MNCTTCYMCKKPLPQVPEVSICSMAIFDLIDIIIPAYEETSESVNIFSSMSVLYGIWLWYIVVNTQEDHLDPQALSEQWVYVQWPFFTSLISVTIPAWEKGFEGNFEGSVNIFSSLSVSYGIWLWYIVVAQTRSDLYLHLRVQPVRWVYVQSPSLTWLWPVTIPT